MASKVKEDEKNEKIIRGLLKQPGNRNCINCNLLGPQYVCTTFSTFVCTTCCSIHREFTHRVKSVSMAKFTPEEMASLQAGGNERAKEVFFKDWDPQRLKSPDSSNVDKLRKFIKHVYVDRRYTGEKSIDKPPRVKKVDKEEPNDNRRTEPNRSDSRSPPYDNERRYKDRPSPDHDVRRKPGYIQDNQSQSRHEKSLVTPVRPGIVSNWRREDRFSKGKKSDDHCSSDGELKPEIKSRDSQNDSSIFSTPTVLPMSDILGENVKPLEISEPPTANGTTVAEDSAITQRTASSSSLESSHGNPTEPKQELSLIDFDFSPETAETATVTQVQQSVAGQSVEQVSGTPIDDSWGCLAIVPENNASQAPPVTNLLESMFSEVSVPALTPVSTLTSSGGAQQPLAVAVNQHAPFQSVSGFPSSLSMQGVTGPLAVTQVPQAITGHASETLEANAIKNQELPMDLFTATYSATPHQGPAWQTGPLPGMGFPVQYNSAMSTPTISQPFQSPNPFDINAAAPSSQAATFPSMSSLHSALPNMAVQGGPSWMPPHTSSYPSAVPGAYIGQQQLHSNMLPQPQGLGNFATNGTHFGHINPAATTPNPSLGANPFG